MAVCVGTPYQIGYLGMPNRSGPTAFWDFYSPHLGELGSLTSSLVFGGFARFLGGDLPSPNLHSHIHTYAATHDCFLLEVFEGLVTPERSKLLKVNKWTNYRGVRHKKIGITTVALQLSGLNICYFPPILPFWISQTQGMPIQGPCYDAA